MYRGIEAGKPASFPKKGDSMYNYQILLKTNKTEIMEKIAEWSLKAEDWEKYEETVDHLLWLFKNIDKEVQKIFFPETKEVQINVQLPKNNE